MPLIGHPIGDIDEHFIIDEIYKPNNFEAGWYFIPYDFPNYTFISADIDPNVEEVVRDGDEFRIQGFDPYLEKMDFPEGYKPKRTEIVKEYYYHYPSGVPLQFQMGVGHYWEMFGDLNNPYMFIPYFNPSTYGQIAWLDFDTPLEIISSQLSFVEYMLKGLIFPFTEKIVSDKTYEFSMKEKIVSLLSCDIELIAPNTLKLTWDGEKVPFIEVLRKDVSDNTFGTPIAIIPFSDKQYVFEIDNNSYIYSVRGSNQTGMSNVDVTIGVRGLTTINSKIDLGDFVKIYEADIIFVDAFETDISI
jgi:hypothetical protein